MSLDRTWVNGLVNDSGNNADGELWDKADVVQIYDDVDDAIAILPTTLTNHGVVIGKAGATLVATSAGTAGQVLTSNGASADPTFQAATGGAFALLTSTSTGAQNNWAPGTGVVGNSLVEWSGASDAAITGLAGGATGRLVTIKNTGSANATFAHNSGSSAAGNKLKNLATSAPTPVAPGGWITYQYDGTDWQLIAHEQGALITPTYSAGIYTASAGTWTVDSGDISIFAYKLSGRMYTLTYQINTTSVSTTPASLIIAFPGGFTGAKTAWFYVYNEDNGTVVQSKAVISGTTVDISKTSGNWTASTNNTRVTGTVTGEIT